MTIDAVLAAVRAVEAETPSGFDDWPLVIEGGASFTLTGRDVVVREKVAMDAMRDATAIQTYSYQDATVFHGCNLVTRSDPPFVLFVFGRVRDAPRARLIGGAFRIYDGESLAEIAADPSLAFATVLDRYGLDYNTGRGERGRFVPVITLPSGTLDATPPVTFERIWPAIALTLDIGIPAEEFIGNIQFKFSDEGEIRLLWPFVLDIRRYTADARDRKLGG